MRAPPTQPRSCRTKVGANPSQSAPTNLAPRAKRKTGNFWYEGDRCLWAYGPIGSTVFDAGEPLPRRGA
jgi:hypothetical protein